VRIRCYPDNLKAKTHNFITKKTALTVMCGGYFCLLAKAHLANATSSLQAAFEPLCASGRF
jgi:hypothetical protein